MHHLHLDLMRTLQIVFLSGQRKVVVHVKMCLFEFLSLNLRDDRRNENWKV